MKYADELTKSMTFLCNKGWEFIGQSIRDGGTFMSRTFVDVPVERLIEFPVVEDFNLQFAFGNAVAGKPTCVVFPRLNFLLLATGTLVNMVDKFQTLIDNKFCPHLIIRSSVGPDRPVSPQIQHIGNYTEPLKKMLTNVEVTYLKEPEDIFPAYEDASRYGIHLIIEEGNFYNSK